MGNFIKHVGRLGLLTIGLVTVAGCQDQSAEPLDDSRSGEVASDEGVTADISGDDPRASAPLAQWPARNAVEDFVSLPGQRWLLLTAAGLSLVDVSGKQLAHQPGYYEALDWRPLAGGVLVSVIDNASGSVVAFQIDPAGQQLQLWPLSLPATAVAEAQCLHQDSADDSLHLFVVGAEGLVSQHLLALDGEQLARDVRSFAIPGEADHCVVADQLATLYLTIEDSGIWALDAAAETDPLPQPMALQPPFGQLQGEVEKLFVVGNTLWAVGEEERFYQLVAAGEMREHRLPEALDAIAWRIDLCTQSACLNLLEADGALRQLALLELPTTPSINRPATVRAVAETDPVPRFGDAADDPAIYVNPTEPSRSVIIGTDKRGGLELYDLDGKRLQRLDAGRLNNVDLRPLTDNSEDRALLAASNRDDNSIAFFVLDDNRQLQPLNRHPTGLDEVYGLCMYKSDSGLYVFINDKDGRYQQYRLSLSDSAVAAQQVRAFALPGQPEGCVAHDAKGELYMGEEAAGVWLAGAEPDGAPARMIIALDQQLVADVEGMGIHADGEKAYLVLSSQGNDSYVVHALRNGYPRLGQFRIAADYPRGIDGVSETDGLEVTAATLPSFPQGLLIVQDGRNRLPDAPQNFKLVDWATITPLLTGEDEKAEQ